VALNLKYATVTQLSVEFRERFRASRGVETYRLGAWLLNRIADGTWTETQVRTFFGLTVIQWNTLKSKLQAYQANYTSLNIVGGE
jgi:hypothetical protein